MAYTLRKNSYPKLFPPYTPQAHKHGIGVRAAAHLLVSIDPYPGMDVGDLLELFWDGCYVASKILSEADIGQIIVLRVPESFLQNGTIKTYYRLKKVGGLPILSPRRRLKVKLDAPGGLVLNDGSEENQRLAAISLPKQVINTGVASSQLETGVELTIEPYLNMAPFDAITLRWGDVRMDLEPLAEEEVGKPVHVLVPASVIREAGEATRLDVTYCVIDRVGNNSRWAPAREISVGTSGKSLRHD